jgi:hypothetical protein
MKNMKMKELAFLAVFLFLIAPAYCLRVDSPVLAGELELMKTYHYTVAMENTENRSYEVLLSITPRSEYLDPYVTMSPNHFVIGPYEEVMINITLNTPSSMPPGEHVLTILPNVIEEGLSGTVTIGMTIIELKFTIPGEVKKELNLAKFSAAVDGNEVIFILNAENTGNVRLGAFPYVEIIRYYGAPAVVLRGMTQYLIGPSSSADMEMRHSFQPGTYYATAYLDYGEETNKITKVFEIEGTEEEQDNQGGYSDNYYDTETNETIDITGEEEPEKTMGIRIRKLEAEPAHAGSPVRILLELENIGPDNIAYDYDLNIFDLNGNKLDMISNSGTLEGYEIKSLENEWSTYIPGDYRIVAELSYEDKTEGKEVWTLVTGTPTGLVIADPSSIILVAAVALLVTAILFYTKVIRRPKL